MRVRLIWDLARLKWAILSEERSWFRRKYKVLGWARKVRLHDIMFRVVDGGTGDVAPIPYDERLVRAYPVGDLIG